MGMGTYSTLRYVEIYLKASLDCGLSGLSASLILICDRLPPAAAIAFFGPRLTGKLSLFGPKLTGKLSFLGTGLTGKLSLSAALFTG